LKKVLLPAVLAKSMTVAPGVRASDAAAGFVALGDAQE
jgi:hypothetical protein